MISSKLFTDEKTHKQLEGKEMAVQELRDGEESLHGENQPLWSESFVHCSPVRVLSLCTNLSHGKARGLWSQIVTPTFPPRLLLPLVFDPLISP